MMWMSAKSSKMDPAWKYHEKLPNLNSALKCRFCGKVTRGIAQAKQHLLGGNKTVKACLKVPDLVKEEITLCMGGKKGTEKTQVLGEDENKTGNESDDLSNDCDSQTGSNHASTSGFKLEKSESVLGGDELESDVQKRKRMLQSSEGASDLNKEELWDQVSTNLARWIDEAGIPPSTLESESFKAMIEAIGQAGPDFIPPSARELRGPLLKNAVNRINELVKEHRYIWKKYGCTLICDSWKDQQGKTLIKFLVNSNRGTVFLESIDASAYSNDATGMFELIGRFVEKVGESNVVQVVTDTAPHNVAAGKLLMERYPNLYWMPCAAQCIDLIMQDLFKLPELEITISRALVLNHLIFTTPLLVNLLSSYTEEMKLLQNSNNLYANTIVALFRINQHRDNIRMMFMSEKWSTSEWAKEKRGKKVAHFVTMKSFWDNVSLALKVFGPLIKVLQIIEGEKRPPMGYIYKAMERAKDLMGEFIAGERILEKVFEIIDQRWQVQLNQPLHLAGHYFNPEVYYDNPTIQQDAEVLSGLHNAIERLVPDTDEQAMIMSEMIMYRNAEDLFSFPIAVRQRSTRSAADWWSSYGASTPNLQKFAIKVLSLTCAATGFERKRRMFEDLHSKERSRRAQECMKDVAFFRYNRELERCYNAHKTLYPVSMTEGDRIYGWLIKKMHEEDDSSFLYSDVEFSDEDMEEDED